MGLFNWGNPKQVGEGVKLAGDGVKSAGEAVEDVLHGVRTLITGDYPPETIEALRGIELKTLEIKQAVQKGQQGIEKAAIEKGTGQSLFIAGWRPMLGWISAAALFAYYVPPVVMQTVFWIIQSIKTEALIPFPNSFDVTDIIGLVGTLLGMGTLRTIEKAQGAQGNH
jgi:hypothetical protein